MHRRHFLSASLCALAASALTPAFAANLSQAEAARGLRDALTIAAQTATQRLGQRDGFFGDDRVRIPLPRALANVQRTLKPLGMSGSLDDLQLRMNRGAETAMPQARRLFVSAIRSITLEDAVGIVSGGDTAATDYLRRRTEPDLTTALRPPMQSALASAGAFRALDRASGALQGYGVNGGDLRGQVIDFAVSKALDSAFLYVGEEERRIRHDPVRQTTSLLRQIFGR
ncbi:MAG: DUF4197 domain-containing protein [Pseudomonadota bacterium]